MLWVRSQSKQSLIKVNNLILLDDNTIVNLGNKYNLKFRIELGRYKTKERALEVLNEIQNYIIYQGQTHLDTDNNGIIKGFKSYSNIYEMPQD